MTESIYKEFENKYYNPDDNGKEPGDNENWQSVQEGFYKIGTTDLETTGALTLGKGTEDEETVTAAELKQMKEGGEGGAIELFTVTVVNEEDITTTTFEYNDILNKLKNNRMFFILLSSSFDGTVTEIMAWPIEIVLYSTPSTIPVIVYESGIPVTSETEINTDIIAEIKLTQETFYVTSEGKMARGGLI